MRAHEFTVGRTNGYRFRYRADGSLEALPTRTGDVQVIGGQHDLSNDISVSDRWSEVESATGNNARISDGRELYAGAGFDGLIEGQVEDVLWALAAAGDVPAKGRLLELGCGPGFLLEALAARLPGWSMVGIDPSPTSCQQARARGVDVREGFVNTVELEAGFDAIVVMGNFQLHEDLAATLSALTDLAAPGCRMFLDSKNPLSTTRRLAARMVGVPGLSSVRYVHAFAAHAFHGLRNAPSRYALEKLLSASGWTVSQTRTVGPRLLRFRNEHVFSGGVQGTIWQAFDRIDKALDQRAWVQVAAVRT